MKRRKFITLLGGAGATWPLAARAQQPAMPVVGFLDSVSVETRRDALVAFRQGLGETGHLESHNVAIEYRWAQGQLNRLPDLAADLVRRQVAVIVVNNAAARAARAARGATSVIPMVFVSGSDPVRTGLVSNLSRPTDNMTGVSYFGGPELVTKRLGLLHECIAEATPIAVLLDPNYVDVEAELREAESAARELKRKMLVVKAGNDSDFHASFSSMAQAGVSGVLVGGGGFFNSQRRQLVTLAARQMAAEPAWF
jgi:putative ABC transport system substrate-binding protein